MAPKKHSRNKSKGRSGGAAARGKADDPSTQFQRSTITSRNTENMSVAKLIKLSTPHANLKETDDPEVQDYLEAHEMFKMGLSCARNMDFAQAKALIVAAFLLDDRAFMFGGKHPPEVPILDTSLFGALLKYTDQPDNPRVEDNLMYVLFAFSGMAAAVPTIELQVVQKAMNAVDTTLQTLRDHPELEGDRKSGMLGGMIRRARMHDLKAALYMRTGNIKQCLKSLADVLASDPKGSEKSAKFSLIFQWAANKMKPDKEVYDELKACVDDSHPDSRNRFPAYSWLAILTFRDYKCGTYEDAVVWFRKADAARERIRYLYGRKEHDKLVKNPIWEHARRHFPVSEGGIGGRELEVKTAIRRQIDQHMAERTPDLERQMERVAIERNDDTDDGKQTGSFSSCIKCGSGSSSDGGRKMLMCACKTVYYCSKECQTEHWPDHKAQCKNARETKKREKSEAEENA